MCGGRNSVTRRKGNNDWKGFTSSILDPERDYNLFNMFNDIDGFNENDICCVGNDEQIYYFNGKLWQKIDFPSNCDLEIVYCAGDGYVYASGKKGLTFKVRGNHWKTINNISIQLPFKDIVWHEECVWCTNDYGV